MNYQIARFNMVESQARTWDVLDQRVLDRLLAVPREEFVPRDWKSLAYADMDLPLGHGEVMLAPKLAARLVQEAAVRETDHVLEIGTGSGYMTALLAGLAARVTSVEIRPEWVEPARARLGDLGIGNVSIEAGDAALGWPAAAPFDAIVVTGSLPMLPDELPAQLAPGGRLVAVVGGAPIMTARLVTRVSPDVFRSAGLFETFIAPLRNARVPERFVF
jgi:protein-L-isoaspartate(D-aspartate) O-methyltransferase